jgi:hypothetical protein
MLCFPLPGVARKHAMHSQTQNAFSDASACETVRISQAYRHSTRKRMTQYLYAHSHYVPNIPCQFVNARALYCPPSFALLHESLELMAVPNAVLAKACMPLLHADVGQMRAALCHVFRIEQLTRSIEVSTTTQSTRCVRTSTYARPSSGWQDSQG